MLRVALKGLAGRKLRAVLTALAIILGVAMISGTFVLTDTINNAFTTIFTQSYKNADAVISAKTAFTNDNGNGVQAPSFSQSLLPKVQALPDVKAAEGSVTDDQTNLVGRNGKVISTHGAGSLAFSVNPNGDQRFNPLTLTAGNWPKGPHEIAIDSHVLRARATRSETRSASSGAGRSSSSASPGSRSSPASRSAARHSPSSTCPRSRSCWGGWGSST
jgi:hypothetical protein